MGNQPSRNLHPHSHWFHWFSLLLSLTNTQFLPVLCAKSILSRLYQWPINNLVVTIANIYFQSIKVHVWFKATSDSRCACHNHYKNTNDIGYWKINKNKRSSRELYTTFGRPAKRVEADAKKTKKGVFAPHPDSVTQLQQLLLCKTWRRLCSFPLHEDRYESSKPNAIAFCQII